MAQMKASTTAEIIGTRTRRSSLRNFTGWRFEPSETVLCFEPDGRKAHVLYEAQILDRTVSTDSKKRTWPEYHVHFLRWSSKWDRIVPESFLLSKCEENDALKKAVRRIVNSGSSRAALKQRNNMLEKVLSACLDMPPLYCGYDYYPYEPDKLSERSLRCDIDALEGFMAEHYPDLDDLDCKEFNASFMISDTPVGGSKSGHSQSDRLDSTPRSTPDRLFSRPVIEKKLNLVAEMAERDEVAAPNVTAVSPDPDNDIALQLPGNLKDLLDIDWAYVVRDGNLHALPASPTVNEILARFCCHQNVTNFPQSDIKSVADSIESLFNVMCSDLLLYINRNCNESTQYSQFVKNNLSCYPSDVYGAWHLLRFFVRFPDLLARLPDVENKNSIMEICNCLLTFLNDYRQQLFSFSFIVKENGSLSTPVKIPNVLSNSDDIDNGKGLISDRKRRKF